MRNAMQSDFLVGLRSAMFSLKPWRFAQQFWSSGRRGWAVIFALLPGLAWAGALYGLAVLIVLLAALFGLLPFDHPLLRSGAWIAFGIACNFFFGLVTGTAAGMVRALRRGTSADGLWRPLSLWLPRRWRATLEAFVAELEVEYDTMKASGLAEWRVRARIVSQATLETVRLVRGLTFWSILQAIGRLFSLIS